MLRAGLAATSSPLGARVQRVRIVGIGPNGPRPHLPLTHAGRWFTDLSGRVVMLTRRELRGESRRRSRRPRRASTTTMRRCSKRAASTRCGSAWCSSAVMPQPGRSTHGYVDAIADTVARPRPAPHLRPARLPPGRVGTGHARQRHAGVGDAHRRAPEPDDAFPLYYVRTRRCSARSTTSGPTEPGPDGVPLQEHYAEGDAGVAKRVRDDPNVLGYEAMNEPWPGDDWAPCLTGCPDLEQQLLAPFYARMIGSGGLGGPAPPGVRRTVHALQLRFRGDVASRRRIHERTLDPRLCGQRCPESRSDATERGSRDTRRCTAPGDRVGRDATIPRS